MFSFGYKCWGRTKFGWLCCLFGEVTECLVAILQFCFQHLLVLLMKVLLSLTKKKKDHSIDFLIAIIIFIPYYK